MGAESGHRGEAICKFDRCRLYTVVDEILRVGFKNDKVT